MKNIKAKVKNHMEERRAILKKIGDIFGCVNTTAAKIFSSMKMEVVSEEGREDRITAAKDKFDRVKARLYDVSNHIDEQRLNSIIVNALLRNRWKTIDAFYECTLRTMLGTEFGRDDD